MAEYSVIGKRVPRKDAFGKATGSTRYCADMKMQGMLYGKIKRSPHPFARIISIDTSKALNLPGVKAVVTAENIRQNPSGSIIPDELPLCQEYVRYVGDEIAAVAAVDEETAEKALCLIEVEYEILSPVFDPEKAREPGAPIVHPELEKVEKNTPYVIDYTRGDPDAFKKADYILHDRFETQIQHHGYIEPQNCICHWDYSGKLSAWFPCQTPFPARPMIANALGIEESRVRVIQTPVGGGFGGKGGPKRNLFVCALLARATGSPVKIVLSRREDFQSGRPAVPEKIDIKLGFSKDGKIVAKEVNIVADAGAYLGMSFAVVGNSSVRTGSLYRIENIRMHIDLVYTNKVATGALRGFGNTQIHFAMESMMDIAADKLGIDPLDLRKRNIVHEGDITVHGWVFNSCGLEDALDKVTEKSGWMEKRKQRAKDHGIGLACLVHASGNRVVNPMYEGSASIVMVDSLGKVKILSGEAEIGQGSLTVFCQIVAEETGFRIEDIDIGLVDTDSSPQCTGAVASRVTTIGGNAVRLAARDVRRQLLEYAGEMLKTKPEDIILKDGSIYIKGNEEPKSTFKDLCTFAVIIKRGGAPITGVGSYKVPDTVVFPDRQSKYGNIAIGYSFGAQVAEVFVDRETGEVKVLDFWSVMDGGRIINPLGAEGQVEGSVLMGQAYALSEEYRLNNGQALNSSLLDYKFPTFKEMPNFHVGFVETENPESPYGVKSIGECSIVATPAAIINAIYDAVGVHIRDIPATPDKILAALKDKEGKKNTRGMK